MPEVDLIQPNGYAIRNNDISASITNGFINHSGDIQSVWGYEKIIPEGWEASNNLIEAFVTSDQRYLLILDIDGVTIWSINKKNKLSVYKQKMYFRDARIQNPDGEDKYGNGLLYRPNPDGFSIIQTNNGLIFITDGSIGGLYILTIIDEREIYFSQLDYGQITLEPTLGYIPPYQEGFVVEMISPVSLEYFNPHIIVIDNQTNLPSFDTVLAGYMHVLSDIGIDNDGKPIYNNSIYHARLTERFAFSKPIIEAKLLNNILYVISYNRIEMYRLSSSNLPIEKIQSNALEVGCYTRNLLTSFNHKLIFIGQNDNKIPSLFVWSSGQKEPVEFNGNNLSYIFNQPTVNISKLTMATFSSSTQEFVIINKLPINLSVLIDITQTQDGYSQNSYYIKEQSGFDADYIFQIGDDYYYLSRESKFLFNYSVQITTFDGKPIIIEVKSMQYTTANNLQLAVVSNFNIILQSMPEDGLNIKPIPTIEYLLDDNRYTYILLYKNPSIGWLPLYDGKRMIINSVSLSSTLGQVIQTDKRTQIKVSLYPKSYKFDGKYYYSTTIIKKLSIDVDIY